MKNFIGFFFFLMLCSLSINAQDVLALNSENTGIESDAKAKASVSSEVQMQVPEIEMYVSPENDVFFQKTLPVYLWVSTSPDPNSKKHLLVNEENVDHFHLDTEGKNTVRSPWAIDPVSGEYKKPMEDVIFDVYSDGIAPVTKATFIEAPKFYKEGKLYYGKGLKVDLSSSDGISGVQKTFVSLNGEAYKAYSDKIAINNEYENKLLYYSTDHVGNFENPVSKDFYVDITAPVTTFEISGVNTNNVLSPDASIILSSSDNLSGIKQIKYKIGKSGTERIYTGPIPLSSLTDGEAEVIFYAIDNVDNMEVEKSTSQSSGNNAADGSGSSDGSAGMSLYIDRIAPEVDIEIQGDAFEGKYTFVSERSRIKLSANDNKAGVEKITYGIDIPSRTNEYTEPFPLLSKTGLQSVNYGAVDKVSNWTPRITKEVYLDNTSPTSNIYFIGDKFLNRDTLFITKNTKIKISTSEKESGIKNVNYNIDGKINSIYTDAFVCEKDGYHKIEYFGVDNVNNSEDVKMKVFVIDNIAPEINYSFSVESIGREEIDGKEYAVYPSNTLVYLGATDNASGVKVILHKLNEGQLLTNTQIGYFKPGNYQLEIIAKDVLNNESKQVLNFKIVQ